MKEQTAPNKDVQKEIADMTEVNVIFVTKTLPEQLCAVMNMFGVFAVYRYSSDLPVEEG